MRVSFSPALKQSGRVKIIKFGAALGEVARVSFSVFVFTAALSARHTEHKKRFEKMGSTCLVSLFLGGGVGHWRRKMCAAAAHPAAAYPCGSGGLECFWERICWRRFSQPDAFSEKQLSFQPSPWDNLHSKSPRFTQKIAPGIYDFPLEFVWPCVWIVPLTWLYFVVVVVPFSRGCKQRYFHH